MFRPPTTRFPEALLAGVLLCSAAAGQEAKPAHTADASAAAREGVALAQKGQCAQALPLLKRGAHAEDQDLKRRVGLGTVRCAMMMDQPETAVDAVIMLNRDFPRDPEVLYVTTHAYSDLSTRASLELARVAPGSYQAHELDAEALEQQGKWDEAEKEYEEILEKNPNVAGIHFRLARVILSRPATPTTAEDAKKELEAELKIDPDNADAEYVLGELAREQQEFDDAIAHFERATKLDPSFPDALRGLGMSLNAAGKFGEAVAPLERYVKLRPSDPAGHYQLAIACARSGRKEEAEEQMKLQQEADEAVRRAQGQAGTPGQPPPSQP